MLARPTDAIAEDRRVPRIRSLHNLRESVGGRA
jgi:hypothetical protein